MDEIRPRRRAAAFANERALIVVSQAGYRAAARDPAVAPSLLSGGASDEEVGRAVLAALQASRFLAVEEVKTFFDRQRMQRDYEDWVNCLVAHYGYQSRQDLFRGMLNCSIECVAEVIEMRPTSHEKLEGWSGDGIDESTYVHVQKSADPASVGAALRLALSRCKSR